LDISSHLKYGQVHDDHDGAHQHAHVEQQDRLVLVKFESPKLAMFVSIWHHVDMPKSKLKKNPSDPFQIAHEVAEAAIGGPLFTPKKVKPVSKPRKSSSRKVIHKRKG
jgi:hypothetical protein